MAQTIPEKLPSQASQGEQRLFGILKRLPDDVIVYYEPVVSNRHPDFVVILPTLGVLVIEVKGWFLKEMIEADSHAVRLWLNERESLKSHPLRQAREYKFAIMDRLREDAGSGELRNSSGPFAGGFTFPFGSFAVLSNITRDHLNAFTQSNLVFPSAHVATRDQLLFWEEMLPTDFLNVLKGYFDPFWPIAPLTDNQVNIIKAVLHPEILLALDTGSGTKAELSVKVLDLRQESLAREIGEGHRLVFGVAGSGKTVILVSRAKLLSRLRPSAQVLVLCFNVPLSARLSDALKDYPRITVHHFDGWAKANQIVRNFQDKAEANDHAHLGQRLLAALNQGAPDTGRYDVVLIDEAQDFAAEWYQCVLKALKDPISGELLIVGDASQGVYGRRNVSWKKLGIQAKGRTKYLERNYRNTQPILEVASLFAAEDDRREADLVSALRPEPRMCVRKAGLKPTVLQCDNPEEEVQRMAQAINDLVTGRYFGTPIKPLQPEEIAVLYRHAGGSNHQHIESLQARLQSVYGIPSLWLTDRAAQARRRIADPGVKIMTLHATKGLQFRAVGLILAHDCPANFSNSTFAEERCLFYVGLTRPEDYLVISASQASPFITEILSSGLMDKIP